MNQRFYLRMVVLFIDIGIFVMWFTAITPFQIRRLNDEFVLQVPSKLELAMTTNKSSESLN